MQEQDQTQSDSWQQPAVPSNSGQPYQPSPDFERESAEESTQIQPVAHTIETPQTKGDMSSEPLQQTDDDAALLRWQATEYIDHDRSTSWYVVLGVVCVLLILIAVLLMKSWTFALLIPIMAVALIVYTRRPPSVVDYTLSRKGLYVNERLYPYDSFRNFSIIAHHGHNIANLVPRKRFQMAQSVYFPTEVGESLVDMLAARMPMVESKPDIFDRITSRLRM